MTSSNVLRINARDNVAVALTEIRAGDAIMLDLAEPIQSLHAIPFAHKVALQKMVAGEPILKYGVAIAFATAEIQPGDWVHAHNAKSYFTARKEAGHR